MAEQILIAMDKERSFGFFESEVREVLSRKRSALLRKCIPGTKYMLAHLCYNDFHLPVFSINSFYGADGVQRCKNLLVLQDGQAFPRVAVAVEGDVEIASLSLPSVRKMPEIIAHRLRLPIFWGVSLQGNLPILLCSFERVDYISDVARVLLQERKV